MLPNILQYPVAIVGAFRAGLTIVNTNPLYTPREVEHQLRDSGARAILILDSFAHTLDAVLAATDVDTVIVTGVGDMLAFPKSVIANFVLRHVRRQVPEYSLPGAIRFTDAMSKGRCENLAPVDLAHEDIAFLQYTGGTTGVSKGAVLTHHNMVANVLQLEAWFAPDLAGRRTAHRRRAAAVPHLCAEPGAVFHEDGRAQPAHRQSPRLPGIRQGAAEQGFTFFSGVNTLFNALLHTPGFDRLDFSRLRVSLGGGMAVQKAVADNWKQVTGNTLTQAWGLTETSPGATSTGSMRRSSPARSGCRFPRRSSRSATTTATCCRRGNPAKSASRDRR